MKPPLTLTQSVPAVVAAPARNDRTITKHAVSGGATKQEHQFRVPLPPPKPTKASSTCTLSASMKPYVSRSQDNLLHAGSGTSAQITQRKVTPSSQQSSAAAGVVSSARRPQRPVAADSKTSGLAPASSANLCKSSSSNFIEAAACGASTNQRRPIVPVSSTTANVKPTKLTFSELQKQKAALEAQVSELVKNAETKQVEMATLHFELNRVRAESAAELERLRRENEGLLAKSDGVVSVTSSSAPVVSSSKQPIEDDEDDDEPRSTGATCGGTTMTERQWDLCSSLSEMSLACLQDRIATMEETHYCTAEELQATLQELTDMQDLVDELSAENEQLANERTLLIDSLRTQTEKLDNCRLQIENLKYLLLSSTNNRRRSVSTAVAGTAEREERLLEVLRAVNDEHEDLMSKYIELRGSTRAAEEEVHERQEMASILKERAQLLEERAVLQQELTRLRAVLAESVQPQPVQRARDAADDEPDRKTHGDEKKIEEELAERVREIVRLETHVARIENELHESQMRLRDGEKENALAKERIVATTFELSARLEKEDERNRELIGEREELEATIAQLQKVQAVHEQEEQEWRQFQADLQVAVVVANDFKQEAQEDIDRLMEENAQLRAALQLQAKAESDLAPITHEQIASATPPKSVPIRKPEAAASIDDPATPASPAPPMQPASSERPSSLSRFTGNASRISVKELIESLESVGRRSPMQRTALATSPPAATSWRSPQSVSNKRTSRASHYDDFFAAFSPPAPPQSADSHHLRKQRAPPVFNIPPADPLPSTAPAFMSRSATQLTGAPTNDVKAANSPMKARASPAKEAVVLNGGEMLAVVVNQNENMEDDARPAKGILVNGKASTTARKSLLNAGDDNKADPLAKLMKNAPRGGSRRNALLKWCQTKTISYPSVEITNFSSSWNDGLAFCALLHSYMPERISTFQTLVESKDKRRCFTIAFTAADEVGIPRLLSVNEMVTLERPDWQSVMNYVTAIYKHFEN